MTISLPPAMAKELEKIRKREHRTRSELIREAFRFYFLHRYRAVTPTTQELRALARGRAAMQKGDLLTLNELRHALDAPHRKARTKKA